MSIIDKQRVTAVATLQSLGYAFSLSDGWSAPADAAQAAFATLAEADAMHALLIQRADKLDGCTEGSEEALELAQIADAAEAYEAKRWPNGKVPGGKG